MIVSFQCWLFYKVQKRVKRDQPRKAVTNIDTAFLCRDGFSSIFKNVNGFPTFNLLSGRTVGNNITRVTMMMHERFAIYNQDVTSLTSFEIRNNLSDDSTISISYKNILRCV